LTRVNPAASPRRLRRSQAGSTAHRFGSSPIRPFTCRPMTLSATTALLIIDVQQGLDDPSWGARNNPGAEQRMAALLGAWRTTRRPVIHVQHMSTRADSPLRPGLPGNALKPEVAPRPGEPVFQKTVNSA